ncbi:hypothetical protein EVAR_5039_1 [Eumeta japonica]|uniref:Uncharacterized protein n=1 Tax=Eumeta variegata TaxID=151549 RepID=A0A4C1SUT1_EUMVA|nr:hypothetical protein EVAR_5039_1 [Eumeta japonica]
MDDALFAGRPQFKAYRSSRRKFKRPQKSDCDWNFNPDDIMTRIGVIVNTTSPLGIKVVIIYAIPTNAETQAKAI